jgi:hypothetical protein
VNLIDLLSSLEQQVEETQKSTPIELPNFAYGHQQVGERGRLCRREPGSGSFGQSVGCATPGEARHLPNAKLWADLIAIKNRMVFYNPAGLRPNKMKASLSLMRDDHALVLQEMICRLDADVRATT